MRYHHPTVCGQRRIRGMLFPAQRDMGPPISIRRRFQFSLRALFALATVSCLFLGGWKFIDELEYVKAGRVECDEDGFTTVLSDWLNNCLGKVDQDRKKRWRTVNVNGRLTRFFGPSELPYCIEVGFTAGTGSRFHGTLGKSSRSWLGIYDVDTVVRFCEEPGRYELVLLEGGSTGRKVASSVFTTAEGN
jgi:hypothetical protein